nr:hypothetical protein [Rickettsia tamurae]
MKYCVIPRLVRGIQILIISIFSYISRYRGQATV